MICIVTVYKSNNYGSLLQARALYDFLSKIDNTVFLNKGQRSTFGILQIRQILASLFKDRNFSKAMFFIRKFMNNSQGWKTLPSVNIQYLQNNPDVIYVLGSDEIWNVARKTCADSIYWGDGLKGKLISYAPSANNTKIEDLDQKLYKEYLSRIQSISVRDSHTLNLAESMTDKSISEVLDPTMLFDAAYYQAKTSCPEIEGDYIAVYLFEKKITGEEIKAIRGFAKSKKMKLVSIGPWIDWCDKNVLGKDNNPFLYYIKAKYVITNTFHGTAFAINFSTQFIAYTHNNLKVEELLKSFELSNRIANGMTEDELINLFSNRIDKKIIDTIKLAKREQSIQFLTQAVKQ